MTSSVTRYDIARVPVVRTLLRSRWPQFLAQTATLAGFVLIILVGLLGSPVGGANFAIIIVWIAWWSALKLVFIPLGGRAWCSLCPLPMPGEWLQRGALLGPAGKRLGLGLRWPQRLRGTWLQAGAFVAIGLFSAVTLTQPRVTGWVLLTLIVLALVTGLVFERRAFCRYLCPIGGFTGLYANLAPVEVRVKDRAVCAQHTEKDCYQGLRRGRPRLRRGIWLPVERLPANASRERLLRPVLRVPAHLPQRQHCRERAPVGQRRRAAAFKPPG